MFGIRTNKNKSFFLAFLFCLFVCFCFVFFLSFFCCSSLSHHNNSSDPKHPACGQRGLFAARKLLPGTHIIDYIGEVWSNDTVSQTRCVPPLPFFIAQSYAGTVTTRCTSALPSQWTLSTGATRPASSTTTGDLDLVVCCSFHHKHCCRNVAARPNVEIYQRLPVPGSTSREHVVAFRVRGDAVAKGTELLTRCSYTNVHTCVHTYVHVFDMS